VKFDNGLILAMEEKNILIDEEAMAMVKANRLREEQSNNGNIEKLKYKLAKNSKNAAVASKGRTIKLKNIFDRQGVDAARQAFEEMQKSGHARAFQYAWAMKHLCETSDESRALMESMKQNGVMPGVAHFNQLINNLLQEEDLVAAQYVYDIDMPIVPKTNRKIMRLMRTAGPIKVEIMASSGRTMKLKNMLNQHGKEAAQQEFEEMQKSGHADAFQYSWAMKELCETSDESRAVMKSMKQNGVSPDKGHFSQLIQNLLHDGDVVAAQHVIDVEIPDAGIAPDDRTIQMVPQAAKLPGMGRVSKLKRKNEDQSKHELLLLQENLKETTEQMQQAVLSGGVLCQQNNTGQEHMATLKYQLAKNGEDSARKYFKTMQQNKNTDATHSSWAMKHLCQSSDEMRALMKSIKQNGAVLNAAHFTQLIITLLREEDIVAALHVFNVDMSAAGIAPDGQTKKMMAEPTELASMGRMFKLKKIYDRQDTAAARQAFEEMQKSGRADAFQYGWAMKKLCRSSDETRALMESMKQNGVMSDVVHFTQLISNLLQEGDRDAAQHIYYVEMPEAGIEPNDITIKTMARANELASMGRMSKLKNMLKQHGKDAASHVFEEMQRTKLANAAHYGWAMKELCQSSDEMRALMESMKQNGVLPDVSNFNQLINTLLHDGDLVAAQHVYDVEMPAAGIVPNDRTKKTIARGVIRAKTKLTGYIC
jgi:uncharacterized protein Yka (UPF0111/DUF47 family)